MSMENLWCTTKYKCTVYTNVRTNVHYKYSQGIARKLTMSNVRILTINIVVFATMLIS